jgi:hypothetical protein
MLCSRCKSPAGSLIGYKCRYCHSEGRIAKLLWRFFPELMKMRRLKQNLRNGGWL